MWGPRPLAWISWMCHWVTGTQSLRAAPSEHEPVQELTTAKGGIELNAKGSNQPLSCANFFKRSLHMVLVDWLQSPSFSETEFPSSFDISSLSCCAARTSLAGPHHLGEATNGTLSPVACLATLTQLCMLCGWGYLIQKKLQCKIQYSMTQPQNLCQWYPAMLLSYSNESAIYCLPCHPSTMGAGVKIWFLPCSGTESFVQSNVKCRCNCNHQVSKKNH